MLRLSSLVKHRIPTDASLVVDISNVSASQVSSAQREGLTPVLISTQKSFNYRSSEDPVKVSRDAWIVLRVPSFRNNASQSPYFSEKLNRFSYRRSPRGSPSLEHVSGTSTCSVRKGRLSKRCCTPRHSLCEIDDDGIRIVCYDLGLPVLTNDRLLKSSVLRSKRAPSSNTEHEDVAKASGVTLLLSRGDGTWRAARGI